jgi:hypothetical protein
MTRVRFQHLQFLLVLAVRPLYPLLLIIMMDRSERVSEGDEKTFLISISDGGGIYRLCNVAGAWS